MSHYTFTRHALDVIGERNIDTRHIEMVMASPEMTLPDRSDHGLEHRLGRISENDNRVLRVIVNKSVDPPCIVTVYYDRTMRNRV